MDWDAVGKWILAAIAAAAVGGLVLRVVLVRKSKRGNRSVTQTNNRAGRDIIGGDKIDKR